NLKNEDTATYFCSTT
nr:immunoglobulin heavy chain junction region [Mus musculus]